MKKILIYCCLAVAISFVGCSTADIDEIKDDLSALTERVESLEHTVSEINSQISALQSLVSALEANDYVTGVSTIYENGSEVGFVISFTYSDPITIYNGSDVDTPTIGVGLYEGEYYWTVQVGDGEAEWLLDDDGNMIPTTGEDGEDGADGQDGADGEDGEDGADGKDGTNGTNGTNGTTPVVSVASYNDVLYWQVNGSWLLYNGEKVPATGEDGSSGSDASIIYTDNGDSVTIYIGDASFTFAKAVDSISFTSYDNVILSTATNALEIIIPQDLGEDSFDALVAEVVSVGGATGFDMVTKSTATSTTWGIEIIAPTYEDGSWSNAKIKLTQPSEIGDDTEVTGVLTVSLINTNGSKSSTSLVFTFMTDEKVAIVSSAAAIADISGKDEITELILGSEVTNENISEILAAVTDAADGLTNVTVLDLSNASIDEVPEGYFNENTTLEEVIIAEGTSIADGAFEDCTSITTVSIGRESDDVTTKASTITRAETVTAIGASAFKGCTSLKEVKLCSDITYVGELAFEGCVLLESIDLPNATEIGDSAFSGCAALPSLDLPKVTTIGTDAFEGCSLLTKLSLATDNDLMLVDVTDAFDAEYVGSIALTLGSANESMVSGLTLIVGSYSATFKSISVGGEVVGEYEYRALSGYSETSYPDGDYWGVSDEGEPTESQFAGLRAAMLAVYEADESRRISLSLPDVTKIPDGGNTFYECYAVETVDIPSVTYIGSWAFQKCTNLVSINMPLVKTIEGDAAFAECTSLKEVSLPEVTYIGQTSFYGCSSLESVYFPKVEGFGGGPFARCTSLTEVELPGTLTSFSGSVFEYCTNLTTINIPSSITELGDSFYGCNKLTNVTFEAEGFDYDATVGVVYNNESRTEIVQFFPGLLPEVYEAPETVTSTRTFMGYDNLKSVTISGLTSVTWRLFCDCPNLETLNLPSAIDFEGIIVEECPNVTSLTIATDTTISISDDDMSNIFGNLTTEDVTLTIGYASSVDRVVENTITIDGTPYIFKEIVVDSGIEIAYTSLALSDFSATDYPETMGWTITDETANIEDFAGLKAAMAVAQEKGYGCYLEFPDLTEISYDYYSNDYLAFKENSYLISVSMPELTSYIPAEFFENSSVRSVEIPKVNEINRVAFYGCSSLSDIDMSSVEKIGELAFADCSSLTEINIDKVTTIGDTAFGWCGNLKTVNSALLETIGGSAFLYCHNLSSMTLGNVKTIGSAAFDCSSLELADLSSAETIGDSAFASNYQLASVTLSDNLQSIGSSSFAYCEKASITIPSTVTSIGSAAFTSVKSIASNSSYYVVEDGAVYDSAKTELISVTGEVESLVLPESVVTIGSSVLCYFNQTQGDLSLGNVTSLGREALNHATISSLYAPKLESVGYRSLAEISGLTSIYLPVLENLYEEALLGSGQTEVISLPSVTELGYFSLHNNPNLRVLELATTTGATLTSIDSDTFNSTTTTEITLILGKENSGLVDADNTTLTVGDVSVEFKKIILVDHKNAFVFGSISDFSSSGFPVTNSWGITGDLSATDLATLKTAISAASGRNISLYFVEETEIPESAFAGVTNIYSVDMPEVPTIGASAFNGCTSLVYINAPKASSIGDSAFKDCAALVGNYTAQ